MPAGGPKQMQMAQDNSTRKNLDKGYNAVGEEVANVLTSAREASADMRAQARQYAESLITGARAEIAEIHAAAEEEAHRIVVAAQDEAKRYSQDSRRQVLRLVEAAQSRVAEAEKAVKDAEDRRESLLALETELETNVTEVISAVRDKAAMLRQRREGSSTTITPSPVDELESLLAESAAVIFAEEKKNDGR